MFWEFYMQETFPDMPEAVTAKSGKTSTIKEEDYYAKN